MKYNTPREWQQWWLGVIDLGNPIVQRGYCDGRANKLWGANPYYVSNGVTAARLWIDGYILARYDMELDESPRFLT